MISIDYENVVLETIDDDDEKMANNIFALLFFIFEKENFSLFFRIDSDFRCR